MTLYYEHIQHLAHLIHLAYDRHQSHLVEQPHTAIGQTGVEGSKPIHSGYNCRCLREFKSIAITATEP